MLFLYVKNAWGHIVMIAVVDVVMIVIQKKEKLNKYNKSNLIIYKFNNLF